MMQIDKGKVEILDGIELYHSFVNELRRENKHVITNMFLNDEDISSLITDRKLFFQYVKGRYLNIYKKEWDFYRLYFYISDFSNYFVIQPSCRIVCDIFFQNRDNEIDLLIAALNRTGFSEYALFTKYSKKVYDTVSIETDQNITTQRNSLFYDKIKTYFDVYTDYVPEEKDAEEYLDNRICFSYLDSKGNILAGAAILVKGYVATEEFIFVDPESRGKGLSNIVRNYWYASISDKTKKVISWVRDDNESSWRHLLNMGYKREKQHKITLITEQ